MQIGARKGAVAAKIDNRVDLRGPVFVLICGLVFSLSYALHSQLPDADVRTKALALLQSYWPYKPRILSAWLVYHLAGRGADTPGFRFAYALVMWSACVPLLDRARAAFGFDEHLRPFVIPCFTMVMLAHYSLPNVFAPYFVYDLPAIFFYLVTLLLLTSRSPLCIIGVLCSALFFLNRETIIVASCHAFAIRAAEITRRKDYSIRSMKWLLPSIAAGVVALIVRSILLKTLDGNSMQMIVGPMYYSSDRLRITENLLEIWQTWPGRQQFLAIGFGIVIYLPFVWRYLPSKAQYAIVLSIIPTIPLVILGNLLEIRVYGEYVPLMAFMLATCAIGIRRT